MNSPFCRGCLGVLPGSIPGVRISENKMKGAFIMMYKIEYDNGKCCNYANGRADLLEWLRILHDEKIDDILKISKSGDVTSVIGKYQKFL